MAGLDGDALTLTRARMGALADELAAVRRDPTRWTAYACAIEGSGRTWHDRHQPARARLLTALTYDHGADDLPLLRFLLAQEVERAAGDPFGGIGDPLEAAATLVAAARDPRDLALLARAKAASFDTACGLDVELLFSAGTGAALRALAALPADECQRAAALMLGDDGRPVVDDDDVAAWWAHQEAARQPWTDEPPLAFLDLAQATADHAWAAALVDAEERGSPRDRRSLESLASLRRSTGQREAELALRREADALDGGSAASGCRLLEALIALGRGTEAAAESARIAPAVLATDGWERSGLGRGFVESCLHIARLLPPGAAAVAYLRQVHALARTLTWRPLVLLELGAAAARHHQRARLAAWYGRQRGAERRRIARQLR